MVFNQLIKIVLGKKADNYKFEFDGNIIITLKPEFRHNIIAVLKSRKNKELKKMDFDSSVYTILQCRRKK